jgi:LmeA-like phospholipid-binding
MTRLLFAAVVLVVLAVAADRIGAYVAGRTVAGDLTSSQRLSRPASVTFAGIPFLTQAIGGRYGTVDLTMEGYHTPSGLVIDRIDATLHGVSAPTGPLLQGRLSRLPVDNAQAVAFVSFPSLESSATTLAASASARTLGSQVVSLTLGGAASNQVVIDAVVSTPLGRYTVHGRAQLAVAHGVVTVRLLPETITGVPPMLRAQAAGMVNLSTLVPPLPFGLRATGVIVDPTGLRVEANGSSLSVPA